MSGLPDIFGDIRKEVFKKNYNNTVPYSTKDDWQNYIQLKMGYELIDLLKQKMINFEINKCLEEIFYYVDSLNKYMDKSEPWNSFKTDPNKAGKDLSVLIECFRIVGIILQPFIPRSANKILNMLNIEESSRLFNKIPVIKNRDELIIKIGKNLVGFHIVDIYQIQFHLKIIQLILFR